MSLVRRHRRPAIWLGIACLVQWALLFAIRTPAWDAAFYYSYARSIVFDGDLLIENDLRLSYPTAPPDFANRGLDEQRTPTGRVASPFALGSSLLWLPWLFVLRFAAAAGQLMGLLPAQLTGYEWYFIAGAATLSAMLGWLAFWLGYRLALVETGAKNALAATLTLLFSTPLLYYQFREPLYSHATSAFITALVLFFWWKSHRDGPQPGRSLALGALIGLAALVRWQHVVYLALPISSLLWWYWDLSPDQRRAGWKQGAASLAVLLFATVAVLSVQLTHWRILYGSWLTVPQGAAYVDWRAPFWRPVLFSTFRGIMPWMPVVLLATAGLLTMVRRKPRLILPLLLVLLLETYVNSSTRDWFGGGGFGPRRYTSELAILLLGYAGLVQSLPLRLRGPSALGAGSALGLHQWLLLRFGLAERIGGRVLSMYPSYNWSDGSYADFGRQLSGRLPELIRAPLDFFALGGSPVQLLSERVWPTGQVTGLLATTGFLLVVGLAARKLSTRWRTGRRIHYAIGVLVASAIAALNLLVLLRA